MQIIYENCLWPLAFPFGQRPKGSGGEHVSRIIAFPCGQRTSFHENSCLKEKEIHEERPFPSQQSPRFSRNRRRRTLKALEILPSE